MSETSKQKNKPVCSLCKKKLSSVFSACRCKQMFCSLCISPFIHGCVNLEDFLAAGHVAPQLLKARDDARRLGLNIGSNDSLSEISDAVDHYLKDHDEF